MEIPPSRFHCIRAGGESRLRGRLVRRQLAFKRKHAPQAKSQNVLTPRRTNRGRKRKVIPDFDELGELLEAMSVDQKLRFKQAVVRQTIHFISQLLPPEEEDDGDRSGIWAATSWLNEPTEEKAHAATMYGVGECWDGGVRNHDYPLAFLNPAWAAGESDLPRAAGYGVDSAPAAEREAALQWQIEAARFILRDEEPPPLDGASHVADPGA